jgi:hypothetical protein
MLKPQRRNHRFGQSLDNFEKATKGEKQKRRRAGNWTVIELYHTKAFQKEKSKFMTSLP